MLVGEAEATTMTINDYIFYGSSKNSLLSNSGNNVLVQGDSNVMSCEPEAGLYATKYTAIQEPTSGFNTAL